MSSQVYGINGLTQVNDRIKAVSSAPTTSTRGKLGDFLVVKSTGYLYYLSNSDAGVYTWIKYGSFTSDVDITGDLNVSGDVVIADGSALLVGSGAVTSFAGDGTLVAGVLAIANTNIAATDIVLVQRIDANSSTAIGFPSYTIVANTSLTITSLAANATTETADVSNIAYVIIKTA